MSQASELTDSATLTGGGRLEEPFPPPPHFHTGAPGKKGSQAWGADGANKPQDNLPALPGLPEESLLPPYQGVCMCMCVRVL